MSRNIDENLSQNILNKVFNGTITEKALADQAMPRVAETQKWLTTDEANNFLSNHLVDNDAPSSTYDNRAEANKAAQEELDNIKRSLEAKFENGEFKVANFLGLFNVGGVNLTIGRETKAVPHRVEKIYKEIRNGNGTPCEILASVKGYAEQAINKPRSGRYQATTDFYKDIKNSTVKPEPYDCPGVIDPNTGRPI